MLQSNRSARRLTLAGAAILGFTLLARDAQAGNVAIVASATASQYPDVQSKIMASGFFGQVDVINTQTTTPTLAQLQAYTAVIVWSNNNFQNPVLLGDRLADYVDAGGGVVVTVFANSSTHTSRYLQGRWLTGNYSIVIPALDTTSSGGTQTLGTVHIPTHPVMNGVTTFSGGSNSYRPTTTSMTPGASVIASWSDGKILVAQHGVFPNRIDLGFYPPSNALAVSWWDQTTDGGKMMANALLYVSTPATPSTPFCLGDGTVAACPCGNTGATGHGCASSAFPGGAILSSLGNAGASATTDTLVLKATDIPGPGLFFQSNGVIGTPSSFGDGHLCAAIGILRLGIVFPSGGSATSPGGLTPAPIHVAGVVASGDVKHYQCWYRSVPGLCNTQNFNLTQGVTLTWGP